VAPGQDDVLMIAVAVCIDRIHHDEERAAAIDRGEAGPDSGSRRTGDGAYRRVMPGTGGTA
jgi:hypothetical protein